MRLKTVEGAEGGGVWKMNTKATRLDILRSQHEYSHVHFDSDCPFCRIERLEKQVAYLLKKVQPDWMKNLDIY